ncbi:nitroreductase/quinone reductase family protein [Microbacterium sp. GXS0129]|uniref:nitroreductase/quinone reductase family protein n=1 Tax=Microbacterium sp. GXS0129 TaxID=3377836 RepID=UPI00383B7D2F
MTNQYAQFNDAIVSQFRANNGHVDRFGDSLILLHHIGAKSGAERLTPVMSIRESPDAWLISGSKAGASDNPAWYHNLVANPDVVIEVAGEGPLRARATVLQGDERDRLWAKFTALSPGFAQYERMTDRVIPVIRLVRRGAA